MSGGISVAPRQASEHFTTQAKEQRTMEANNIRTLRQNLGLTQEEFAHRLGITVATVNRWENGHNSPTRLARKALLDLAAERGVPGPQLNDPNEG
jgi:DNA-binding transcriptional regulator YiaG